MQAKDRVTVLQQQLNSQQVLNTLSRINYFSLAKHNDNYDFSTLYYTSIPHDSLKHAMKCLIQEAYKVRDNMFLVVRGNGKAIWSDVPSTKHSFSEDKLTSHVEYLMDHTYVNLGNKVFRQRVGIPMGTDCAPLLANLFLFYYEYKYMKKLIKTNIIKARRFNNTMRYIDDLLVLNNPSFEDEVCDGFLSRFINVCRGSQIVICLCTHTLYCSNLTKSNILQVDRVEWH